MIMFSVFWMQGVLSKILLGHALRDLSRFRRGRKRRIVVLAVPALSPAFAWDWILDKGLLKVGSSEGMYLPHFSDISLTFHLHPKILLRRFTGFRILLVNHAMPTTTTILPSAASERSAAKPSSSSFSTFSRYGRTTPSLRPRWLYPSSSRATYLVRMMSSTLVGR